MVGLVNVFKYESKFKNFFFSGGGGGGELELVNFFQRVQN